MPPTRQPPVLTGGYFFSTENLSKGDVPVFVPKARQKGRLAGLDALRTLAIFGVTFFHMFPDRVKGGYLGVSLFFVLSGFLLAYTSEREQEAGGFSLLRYYGKKLLRIYPPLLLMLLVSIGAYHILAPAAIEAVRPEALSILLGYNNWWQISQNADYFARMMNASPFTHLWFLGIELQFFLIWPLFFLLFFLFTRVFSRRVGSFAILIIALDLAILMPLFYQQGMDITRLYYGTDTRSYALLLGAALGFFYTGKHGKESLLPGAMLLAGLAVTVGAYLVLDGASPLVYEGGMLSLTLLFCAMLALLLHYGDAMGSAVENRFFRWVGKKSYAIFLWQYPVLHLFAARGWDAAPFAPALELAAILILSIWSDAVTDCVTRLHLPGPEYFFLKRVAFSLTCMAGIVCVAYGITGIAFSKNVKADEAALRQTLTQNAEKLAAEKEADAQQRAEEMRKAQEAARARGEAALTGVTMIGDSVMLGSADSLLAAFPGAHIDAEVSRYVGGGLEIAKAFAAQGQLGNVVVIALGTNGPVAGSERYEAGTRALLDYLTADPNRRVFWVNVYAPRLKWQDTNNAYIAHIPERYGAVTVVDWYSAAKAHPEWLVSDHIHPNAQGAKAYADLLRNAVIARMGNDAAKSTP